MRVKNEGKEKRGRKIQILSLVKKKWMVWSWFWNVDLVL